jgi:hypothetical protein
MTGFGQDLEWRSRLSQISSAGPRKLVWRLRVILSSSHARLGIVWKEIRMGAASRPTAFCIAPKYRVLLPNFSLNAQTSPAYGVAAGISG